ncbi:MAG: hypothetical protein JO182_30470, partial [Acidobacteriaceae bacterium]|nr:hypothetical protein [Acidobacteriaceae bacterium]
MVQDLHGQHLGIPKLGVSFQIATPPSSTPHNFIGTVSGNLQVQPPQNVSIPSSSISGRLGFSLDTPSGSVESAPSKLTLATVQITGTPVQLTGRSTGQISISIKGPIRPSGQATPSSTTVANGLALAVDFTGILRLGSSPNSFNIPMQLRAAQNTTTGQISGLLTSNLPSSVPLLGGTTMTLNISVSPLTGSAVIPDQGLTPYGTYARVTVGGNMFSTNQYGNLNIDPVDLSIAGRGLSVVLERYYNSLPPQT